MKKRLLSMLLLAVMLVSAIPFTIFASAAGATAEEEPYDYNSLYVDDKLILAFDIMASNGFAGQALAEFPVSPMMTDDFSELSDRYDYTPKYFIIATQTVEKDGTVTKKTKAYDQALTVDQEIIKKYYPEYFEVSVDPEAEEFAGDTEKYKEAVAAEEKADADAVAALIKNLSANNGSYENEKDAKIKMEALQVEDAKEGNDAVANATDYTWSLETYSYVLLQRHKSAGTFVDVLSNTLDANVYGFMDEDEAIEAAEELSNTTYEYIVIGADTNQAYRDAMVQYAKDVTAWLKNYIWKVSGSTALNVSSSHATHAASSNRRRDSMMFYSPFLDPEIGKGYITLQPYSADHGIYVNNLPQTDEVSTQLIVNNGDANIGRDFMLLSNIGFAGLGGSAKKELATLTNVVNFDSSYVLTEEVENEEGEKEVVLNEEGKKWIDFFQKNSYSSRYFKTHVDDALVAAPASFAFASPTSLTFSLTGALSENGDKLNCDTYSLVTPGETLFNANGIYTGTTDVKEKDENGNTVVVGKKPYLYTTSIIGYSNNLLNDEIYAIRYYAKDLSAEEIMQNHFADIAKWYQLDMSIYETLSNEQKKEARDTIVALVLSNDALSFSSKTAARTEIQTKFDAFALEAIYGQLTDAPETFKDIAKKVRADISGVLALPAEYRGSIYDAVIDLNDDGRKDRAIVQATIAAAIDNVLNLHYSMTMNKTAMTYKDIYVHKDNLVIWVDFFAAKATDGKLYDTVSYVDTLTKWDRTLYGTFYAEGKMVPNWDLPAQMWSDTNGNGVKDSGEMVDNKYLIKVPQVSNMAEAYAKYIHKGGDKDGKLNSYGGEFAFYDLPDAGYGHSNIRTYGDGCLIGGLNNSLKVFSPGKDSDVTYQFVTNLKGNLQLDGVRAGFELKNNSFKVPSFNYYGYGVNDGYTLKDAALISYYPNKTVAAGTVMDMTITLDKTIGQDAGHYYTEVYDTNAEGAVKYLDSVTGENLYRYVADGTQYLCSVSGNAYKALYTVNAVGNKFYIAHDGKAVESVLLVKGEDGSFTVNWDSAVYRDLAEDEALSAGADHVNGPYYIGPSFPEVSSDTPGATGPIVYYGTYDIGFYANGFEYFYLSGIPYTPSDIGSVGNAGDLTTYAIRTYNIVLTEEEIRQNHFADLAGFYGFDLAIYALLTDEQKYELHTILADLQLGLSKNEGNTVYQEALDAVFYTFDTEIEGAENFLAICHAFGLDASELAQLSPETQAEVFRVFSAVDAGSHNYACILQKALNDAIAEQISNRYAAAFGHKTITFKGWNLHQVGDYGLRAVFATDLDAIADLESDRDVPGATVKTGLLVAEKNAAIKSLEDVKLIIGEDGSITAPEGVTLVKGYWAGEINEKAWYDGNTILFTEETLLGLAEEEDEDVIAEALEDREFFYVGFSVVEYTEKNADGTPGDKVTTAFYENATLGGKADSFSVYEVSAVAKYDYKIATKNIQTAMNLCEDEVYITASVGANPLEKYLLVRSVDAAIIENLQGSVEAALGFQLNTVRANDVVAGKSGYIKLGSYDNLYSTTCYGISTFGGNVCIWANIDADIEDAVALFTEYLDLQLASGADAIFEENVEIVCRGR